MTCLLQAGGIGGEGTLPFDYAQSERIYNTPRSW